MATSKLRDVDWLAAVLTLSSSRRWAVRAALLVAVPGAAVACSTETGVEPAPTATTGGTGGATTTTTSSTGTTGGTGGASSVGGRGGAAGATACVNGGLGEPNETESTAFVLKGDPIADCDSAGGHISGVVAGEDDVDWFTYRGNDAIWPVCVVDPTREIHPADAGLRICAFFQCYSPPTDIGTCPSGTTQETSPEGRPGCCGSSAFTVADLTCHSTIDDDAHVFIRVDHPSPTAETCAEYLLNYHY